MNKYTEINVIVTGQNIQLGNNPLIASGGVNSVKVNFTFCSMWEGMAKTAVFYKNPSQAFEVLLTDDSAVVPLEVLTDSGEFRLGVVGTNETQVFPSGLACVTIRKGAASIQAVNPGEPTPDIYRQILAAYGDLVSADGKAAVIRVRDTNGGRDVTFWVGTQKQYKALDHEELNCIYIFTDGEEMADHISYYWENIDNYGNLDCFVRKYANGSAEAVMKARWDGMSFQTAHNGFYAYDGGRVRVGLDPILNGVVPEYCSVSVAAVTKVDENGAEVFGPPVMAMVCGSTEYVENYGVASPRILLLADESAASLNVELELHCRWKWNKQEAEA